jgi:hypothetical protein
MSWLRGGKRKTGTRSSDQNLLADILDPFGPYAPYLKTTMTNLEEESISNGLQALIKSSSPVYALMQARLQVFSQIQFQWTRLSSGTRGELFGTQELSVLERPWPGGTTADLLARMEMDVTGYGNAYYRRLRTRNSDRLIRLKPDHVTIVMGSRTLAESPAEAPDVELLGYMYSPKGPNIQDQATFFGPEEIAHYAPIPDPEGIFVGMSWLTPALKDILGDNLQTDHKRAFLRNAATPNLLVTYPEHWSREQVEEFVEDIENRHRGSLNAYKTLYLGGGADAKPIGKDFKELEFAVTQGKAESRMAAAAGVPPSWVGFSEGLQGSALNAGNFTSARRRFSDGTMQHLWSNVASSLEVLLDKPTVQGRRDDSVKLWFSTKDIPFLAMDASDASEIQGREAATIVALVRDGFTAQSALDAVSNSDWSRLVHSGLLSVQLQPPLTETPQSAVKEPPADNADSVESD